MTLFHFSSVITESLIYILSSVVIGSDTGMRLAVSAFGLKIPDLDLVCIGVFMGTRCEVVLW